MCAQNKVKWLHPPICGQVSKQKFNLTIEKIKGYQSSDKMLK